MIFILYVQFTQGRPGKHIELFLIMWSFQTGLFNRKNKDTEDWPRLKRLSEKRNLVGATCTFAIWDSIWTDGSGSLSPQFFTKKHSHMFSLPWFLYMTKLQQVSACEDTYTYTK